MAGSAAGPKQVVTAAARKERTAPVGVVAGVSLGELAGDPDRVAVNGSRAVVAPARSDRIGKPLLLVAGETVVTRSSTRRDDVRVADAERPIYGRIRRTRIRRGVCVRERHYATASCGDANRRICEGSAGNAVGALHDELAVGRIQDVPRDPGPVVGRVTIEADAGVECAPELTVGEHDLLHAGVIRVGARNYFRPSRVSGGADEQLPAARGHAVEEQCRLVVQAVALCNIRCGSLVSGRTRAGLHLLWRDSVLADGYEVVAQAKRWRRCVKRRRIRQRPSHDLCG